MPRQVLVKHCYRRAETWFRHKVGSVVVPVIDIIFFFLLMFFVLLWPADAQDFIRPRNFLGATKNIVRNRQRLCIFALCPTPLDWF